MIELPDGKGVLIPSNYFFNMQTLKFGLLVVATTTIVMVAVGSLIIDSLYLSAYNTGLEAGRAQGRAVQLSTLSRDELSAVCYPWWFSGKPRAKLKTK